MHQTSYGNAQSNQYPSLKDIFQQTEKLWKPIFGQRQPIFKIYRTKITRKIDVPGASSNAELGRYYS